MAQTAHEPERLVGREPAGLGGGGLRRTGGIDRVDVERAAAGSAAQSRETVDAPGHAALLHVLDANHLEAVRGVKVEVLGTVERPANADLDRARAVDQAFLHGATE